MTEPLSRTSALSQRHRDLGSGLEDWNGMGTAWTYGTDPDDEHDAIREAAGLFDMSGLKKVRVRGPDADSVIDHVITRNMALVNPGQSAYGAILTDQGTVCDDAIVANNGADGWLLVHGSGESMERLQESAGGRDVDIELDDDLHDISLQGPGALEFLSAHTPLDLASLPYFHQQPTELFGHSCILSRTGYSGERGYEIFAGANDIGDIWDNIVGQGAALGIMPCSFTSLDKVRIEAGLLFYGYDMTTDHTPWEVGLGWAVSRSKGDFRGRDEVFASEGKERFKFATLDIDHADALAGGETIMHGDENVGVVNSPAWSRRMKKSLALCHVRPDLVEPGTRLSVSADDATYDATVAVSPVYDTEKTRTHA